MSAASSSLAVAAAAIGAATHSLSSSSSIDHLRLLLHNKQNPIIKLPSRLKNYAVCSPFSPRSSHSAYCVSTALDGVELDDEEEEDGPESGVEETGSEEEGDVALTAEAGRLYVGNLPFSMSSAQLNEIFAEAGRVVSVEIVYDRVTDRSRGFAFVTMGSVEEAKEAIRLFNGAQIGGRTSKVNFPEVPRGGEREVMGPKIKSNSYQGGFVDSPFKIYAGNLSWTLTSQQLRDVFSQQPGYLSARVIFDRDSGRSRGFGFVTFTSAEDVESALNAMNGKEVEGRPLRLNVAEQKAQASPTPVESEDNVESNEMLSSV